MNFQEKLPQLEDLMNIHAQIIIVFHRKILNKDQLWQEDQFLMGLMRNLQGQQWIVQVQIILKVIASHGIP